VQDIGFRMTVRGRIIHGFIDAGTRMVSDARQQAYGSWQVPA
jgi:hypothetical protein